MSKEEGVVIGCIALILAGIPLEAWVIEKLWNWLAVGLFHAPVVSFWQAAGLMLLLWIVGAAFRHTTKDT
jgi:hypothetical protein